jgi:tetratricopeptide (TPR) repeat protein
MPEDELRDRRYERLRRVWDKPLPALTVLRARRYLVRYPDDWMAWIILGSTLTDLARYEEAAKALENALRLAPIRGRVYVFAKIGHLHRAKGDYDRAAEWYRRAVDAAPTDAAGRIYLGAVLAKQGRLAEAAAMHRSATEDCYEGCIDEAFLNLGFVLRAQERFTEARAAFLEALHLDPQYEYARRALRDVERCLAEGRDSAEPNPGVG